MCFFKSTKKKGEASLTLLFRWTALKVERLWLALWELGEIVGALVIEETTKSYAKTITARNFIVRSRSDTYPNCL